MLSIILLTLKEWAGTWLQQPKTYEGFQIIAYGVVAIALAYWSPVMAFMQFIGYPVLVYGLWVIWK